MDLAWELRESGPSDGEPTVLLLPGGLCSAGCYAELMAQPALAGIRLIAATLPGHAGTSRGHVFFLPGEVPDQIADVILEAVAQRHPSASAPNTAATARSGP